MTTYERNVCIGWTSVGHIICSAKYLDNCFGGAWRSVWKSFYAICYLISTKCEFRIVVKTQSNLFVSNAMMIHQAVFGMMHKERQMDMEVTGTMLILLVEKAAEIGNVVLF